MGANNFGNIVKGKTAAAAFDSVVKQARWEVGNGGYSGTIAEKHSFVMIDVPAGTDPILYADRLLDADDRRISDKWGPAGCVKVGEGEWYFFGWASS